jgi:hypothetical protein
MHSHDILAMTSPIVTVLHFLTFADWFDCRTVVVSRRRSLHRRRNGGHEEHYFGLPGAVSVFFYYARTFGNQRESANRLSPA